LFVKNANFSVGNLSSKAQNDRGVYVNLAEGRFTKKKRVLAVNDTLWYTYKKLLKMAIYNRFTLQTV